MKVGVYVRVSTEEQDLESQLSVLRDRFAGQIVAEYCDKASGKDLNRPEWARLMSDARAGRIDTIAVVKIDRISRSLYAFVNLTKELEVLNVGLYSLDLGYIDYKNPATKVLVTMLATFAEFERNLIIDRTKAALATKRKNGIRLGRPPNNHPYHTIALMRIQGKTYREIARATGIPYNTVKGSNFRKHVNEEIEKIEKEGKQ